MAKKNYYGCCGSCKFCELGDNYTSLYTTKFLCSKNAYRVKADEKPCNHYEPDNMRTNDIIEKYDK